jgi:hypothetical protein
VPFFKTGKEMRERLNKAAEAAAAASGHGQAEAHR